MAAPNPGNWKHASGPAKPTGTPAAGASRRAWQPGAAKPTAASTTRSRGRGFLFAGLFAALLIAGIIAVILLLKPAKFPEMVLVAPAAGDSLAVPANAPGSKVVAGLGEWAKAGQGDRPKLAAGPEELANADAWKAKIDGSAASTVLYFAAAGGADAEGPFLWFVPPDAAAPEERHKVRVKDVLARLAGLKAGQPKLLVFDLARSPVSWPHGNFFPDFARALKELDGEIAKVENLAVICSCDADETAWVAEELRETAFGHFARTGLAGAAGQRIGDRITGASLFKYAQAQTTEWASVNRNEKQTPILLPAAGGEERAAQVELAGVTTAAPPAADPAPPEKAPAALEAEWLRAEGLWGRTPAPDSTDPARWRRYLETLLRWEHALRLGQPGTDLQTQASALGKDLADGAAGVELPAVGLGLRVGPALGYPVPKTAGADADAAFNALWPPPSAEESRSDKYQTLSRGKGTAFRLALAARIVDEVAKTGTLDDLKTADALLTTIDGTNVGTAEGHLVKMLARLLDPTKKDVWPKLVRDAVALARAAEEAALAPAAAEQVFRWTRKDVDEGDARRRLAEDCLFAADAASYAEAEKEMAAAKASYAAARETARAVADALAARDAALARLPYYGRWLAGHRGGPGREAVPGLLANVEEAARNAHDITALAAAPPANSPKEAVDQLRDKTAALKEARQKVEAAFTDEVRRLSNEASQRNWHALDGALAVPFIPAARRAELFGHLRSVSYTLAQRRAQAVAAGDLPPTPQETAQRALRVAKAVANDPTPRLQGLVEQPNPAGWWVSFREAADLLGKTFRALPAEMKALADEAAGKPLPEAAKLWATAAQKARVADPAAAGGPAESPPATERRYWQHKLLLNQARRATGDGWADGGAGEPLPKTWYCRRAADDYLKSARARVGGAGPLSPPEEARRFAECKAEGERQAVVLAPIDAPGEKEVADEPRWTFTFALARPTAPQGGQDVAVGFPVWWLTEPGEKYHKPTKGGAARFRETAFAKGAAEAREPREFPAAKAGGKADPGELVTTVLYRGHQYRKATTVVLAGTPTLDVHHAPPPPDKREAAFAVLGEQGDVAGAVTILIDLTDSMERNTVGNGKTRLTAAKEGVEKLLAAIPRNTAVTIAGFYGSEGFDKTDVFRVRDTVTLDGSESQREAIMKAVEPLKAPGLSTPLAGAIRVVLAPKNADQYWPKESTGTRTLIVVTDGEDNWALPPEMKKKNYYPDEETPAAIVVGALRKAPREVALHIVFFGMDAGDAGAADEEKRALKQFGPAADDNQFQESKTGRVERVPARLYKGIKDADGLADALRGAMRATVGYTDQARRDLESSVQGRVTVSLREENKYHLSPRLRDGTYHLWAAARPQQLTLDAGDRVLLRTWRPPLGGAMKLVLPPIAYDLARQGFGYVPHAKNQPPDDRAPLHMTLPDLVHTVGVGVVDLRFTATLETSDDTAGLDLYRQPPRFAWFDAAGVDGPPRTPAVRIVNQPGLFAPAWTLDLKNWDATNRGTIRRPAVTGHWIEAFPAAGVPIPVSVQSAAAARDRFRTPFDVQGVAVSVEGIDVETWGEKAPDGKADVHPEGRYLVVRLKYPAATKTAAGAKVLLRPGKLGGISPHTTLHERHTYFDDIGRYTARFGPLSKADEELATDLMLYSVAELRKAAEAKGRAVTVTFPENRSLTTNYTLPPPLRPNDLK